MALFVISWMDKPEALPQRLATRQAHLDYLAAHSERVKLGGPYLRDGHMAGSMLIVEADDLAAAQAFHDADPYTRAGVFDRSTVTAWRLVTGSLG